MFDREVMFKKLILSACLLIATTAYALSNSDYEYMLPNKQATFPVKVPEKALSAELGGVTNYVYHGITQTDDRPAAQIGLTYTFVKTGFYLNLWTSNDYFYGNNGDLVTYETDPTIGINNNINANFSYDISISRYTYPKLMRDAYTEFNVYLYYYFLIAQYSYSKNIFATGKKGNYYYLGFNYDIPPTYFFHLKNISVSGGAGYSHFPNNPLLRSYLDHNLAISKKIDKFTFTLQWTNTDRRAIDPSAWKCNKFFVMMLLNL